MYFIIFDLKAKKQLEKLQELEQRRIISTLERIKIRPHHFVKRIQNTKYFRLRVGDYRVILDIQNNELVICVIELGHRKNIYKS